MVFLLAKNIAYWKTKEKSYSKIYCFLKEHYGDIEENPGVLDQCYSNNNFVTAAVLGVKEIMSF